MKNQLNETLKKREETYGPFSGQAELTQGIKKEMQTHPGWINLSNSQCEALEMIAHKIGRIINGDPNYTDSWHDIAGYARLVEKELQDGELGTF